MVYFLLAVLSSVLVSVTMRLSQNRIRNNLSMLACNYVACAVLAVLFSGTADLLPNAEGLPYAMVLGVVSGLLYLAGFLLLQWNIRKNGVALPATFMKLGVLVPTVLSVVLFGEKPSVLQVLGIVLAVAAILLIQSEKGHGKAASGIGLILLLLSGGTADVTSKFFEFWGNPALKDHYLFYTFAVATLVCIVICVIKRQSLLPVDVTFGLIVGIPNYFSARFLLLALQKLPAIFVFPGFSVGTIVAVTAVGALCFKERLTRRQLIAMGVILISLVLLNL